MLTRRRSHRSIAVLAAALLFGGLLAGQQSTAAADFHEIKITEIHAADVAAGNDVEAVEVQMYSNGQGNLSGHVLKFYDAAGTGITDCTVPADAPDPGTQKYVSFATAEFMGAYGHDPDFTMPAGLIAGSGGAICWGAGADCVTWGSFSGSVSDADGPVVNPEDPIPDDMSIHRDLGDATLNDADDTNNSNNDFFAGGQNISNNIGGIGTLTCQPGTPTSGGAVGPGGTGGDVTVNNLKTKTPGNKAVVSGQIAPPDPGDVVTVKVLAKGSPFKKVGKKKDTLDADSRFKVRIGGVPDDAVKCKATVKYAGNIEATKKFNC